MSRQTGALTAEFGLVLVLFLTMACAVLELARLIYLYNTLQVATQRAAALAAQVDFRDAAALDQVRRQAVLRDSAGGLLLGAPVTDAHIRIDYLALSNAGGVTPTPIPTPALPSCPANNRIACMADPYGDSCIRLVRARVCDPAVPEACNGVPYQPLFSFLGMRFNLPKATVVTSAETLGAAGQAPCP
ncbi:TadE family protein [Duganella aceris]|uniref:TadE family protein n=1 Tax=Duganella aceris TaxID=2703883 RepID=UPI003530DBD1